MNPTTLKLPAELKKRIAALIEGTGQSMHAFMVEAIAQQTLSAERRKTFIADAIEAKEDMERTGVGYEGRQVHAYMDARAQGKKLRRPKAKPWRE